jgi:hypothetical protein
MKDIGTSFPFTPALLKKMSAIIHKYNFFFLKQKRTRLTNYKVIISKIICYVFPETRNNKGRVLRKLH